MLVLVLALTLTNCVTLDECFACLSFPSYLLSIENVRSLGQRLSLVLPVTVPSTMAPRSQLGPCGTTVIQTI